MKRFGFQKTIKKNLKYYIKHINTTFFILIIFCFSFFTFYHKTTNIIFSKDKINIFQDNLEQIAFYFRSIDKDLSNFLLELNSIKTDYLDGKNILITKKSEINNARTYLENNKYYLKKMGFSQYDKFLDFLSKLHNYQNEIFSLLGKDKEFNYLIILQNTNEKRPNGGFFGSFVFLSLKGGHITNFEVVDSYYPDFIANKTYITAPDRTKTFLINKKIGFLTSNKFGFTDIDGKNIKTLYEKMFNETYDINKVKQTMKPELYNKLLHKNIKGVIFIRSDLLENIIPGFTKKIRERQFVNASIDIIRGETRGNKKELYIKEVNKFFKEKKTIIAENLIKNFDTILNKNYIQMYFSNISTGFNHFLINNNLENVYSSKKIYARDTNNSNSKVDSFITKNIQIKNQSGIILIDTNNDIIDISKLGPGIYTMNILYSLNVPEYYFEFIKSLEQKYGIKITAREEGILALKPAKYTPTAFPRRRETRSTIYFPPNSTIYGINGELMDKQYFISPFAKGVYYQSRIVENNKTRLINIKFSLD